MFYEYWGREYTGVYKVGSIFLAFHPPLTPSPLNSHIDTSNLSKPVKIYPLPHMYVIKDLVPVSTLVDNYAEGNFTSCSKGDCIVEDVSS